MLSARRQARFGLAAAATIFLVAVSILLAGAFERPNLRAGLPGSPAASFRLPDLNAKMVSSSSLRGSVTVLCFLPTGDTASNPSPDTKRLAELARHYAAQSDVKLVTIHSNTEDLSAEQLRTVHDRAVDAGPGCLTLLDPTGYVSRRYSIDQAPTFFVIDAFGTIRYRGGIDDPSPDAPLASTSFTNLIDLLLAERPIPGQPAGAVLGKIK